jgi:hypothetical protein
MPSARSGCMSKGGLREAAAHPTVPARPRDGHAPRVADKGEGWLMAMVGDRRLWR